MDQILRLQLIYEDISILQQVQGLDAIIKKQTKQQVDQLLKIGQESPELTPVQVISTLLGQCTGRGDETCQKFQSWKQTNQDLLKLYQQLPKQRDIHESGWLSNTDIDNCLDAFSTYLGDMHAIKTTTIDYNTCDFRQNQPADVEQYIKQWNKQLDSCDPTKNNFISIKDTGLQYVSELVELNSTKLKNIMDQGKNTICCVTNTTTCGESGQHWVCFVINIKQKTIDIFNSSPGSKKQLCVLQNSLNNIKGEFQLLNINMEINRYDKQTVQRSDHACGLFCLFFILNRAIGIPAQTCIDGLKQKYDTEPDDLFMEQFKNAIFK